MESAKRLPTCPGCGSVADGPICSCGTTLTAGRFRITQVISQGDHSRVYRAVDPSGRLVALKELAFAFAPDARTIDAFDREAALLKALALPGIPRFVEAFQDGSGAGLRLYLAQELIEGEPLDVALQRGPLPEGEVRQVAREVLETLRALHTHDPPILHRDIKPANLIRRPDGRVILVDLGAAREARRGGTHGATLVGTYGYMPPEQLGGSVDETSDLYALGSTLLHLATARPPGDFLRDGLTLDVARAKVPPGLAPLIARLAAPRRSDRFQSAAEALASLDAVPTAAATHSDTRGPALVFVAAVAFVVLSGAVMAIRHAMRPAPMVAPAPAPLPSRPEAVATPEPPPPPPRKKLEGPLPRVAFLIAEQSLDSTGDSLQVVETQMMGDWAEVGFAIEPVGDKERRKKEHSVGGFPADVDVVVMGTAIARNQGNLGDILAEGDKKGPSFTSCRGIVSVRALDREGRILATVKSERTALHLDAFICGYNALKTVAAEAS